MYIGFKHYKTFQWIEEKTSDELPIVPDKGDVVWLKGHHYKVKSKQFNIIDGKNSLMFIYVKEV